MLHTKIGNRSSRHVLSRMHGTLYNKSIL